MLASVTHDEEAEARATSDGLGIAGGLGIAAIGLAGRRRKEGM